MDQEGLWRGLTGFLHPYAGSGWDLRRLMKAFNNRSSRLCDRKERRTSYQERTSSRSRARDSSDWVASNRERISSRRCSARDVSFNNKAILAAAKRGRDSSVNCEMLFSNNSRARGKNPRVLICWSVDCRVSSTRKGSVSSRLASSIACRIPGISR